MKLNRRSVIGGLVGSAVLASVSGPLAAMAGQRSNIPMPRFRNTREVGPPHPNAVLAMHLILDAVGIERRIGLFSARITRDRIAGFATVMSGRRFIVYDRQRVPWPAGVTPVTSAFLVAHEIGHHTSSHVHRRDVSGHEAELEADRFAGFALSRLGIDGEKTISYYQSDRPATQSHPATAESREAVLEGWSLGERMKRQERRRS